MVQTITSFAFFLFGLFILCSAQSIPQPKYESLGGGFFPIVLALALMGLSAVLTIQGIVRWKRDTKNPEIKDPKKLRKPLKPSNLRIIVTSLLTLIYVLVLKELGFVVSTMIFLATIMTYLSKRTKKQLFYIGVVTITYTIFIYYIFQSVLKIFLP